MLRKFELIVGFKVNYHKFFFGAIGVEGNTLKRFSSIMNCKIVKLSFVYLGIPIDDANPRKEDT